MSYVENRDKMTLSKASRGKWSNELLLEEVNKLVSQIIMSGFIIIVTNNLLLLQHDNCVKTIAISWISLVECKLS